jgi:hypothetical protein
MLRGVEVSARVPAGRGIATADVAAREALSKRHPPPAGLEAFLAAVAARREVADLVQMGAVRHDGACGLHRVKATKRLADAGSPAALDTSREADTMRELLKGISILLP